MGESLQGLGIGVRFMSSYANINIIHFVRDMCLCNKCCSWSFLICGHLKRLRQQVGMPNTSIIIVFMN